MMQLCRVSAEDQYALQNHCKLWTGYSIVETEPWNENKSVKMNSENQAS